MKWGGVSSTKLLLKEVSFVNESHGEIEGCVSKIPQMLWGVQSGRDGCGEQVPECMKKPQADGVGRAGERSGGGCDVQQGGRLLVGFQAVAGVLLFGGQAGEGLDDGEDGEAAALLGDLQGLLCQGTVDA